VSLLRGKSGQRPSTHLVAILVYRAQDVLRPQIGLVLPREELNQAVRPEAVQIEVRLDRILR
jgi:hypothetical protein